MRFRFGLLAAVACLGAAVAWGAPQDNKAVYYDATQTQGWMGADARDYIHDYLVSQNYTDLDATGVKTWMDARIKDHVPSVIVMSQDIYPTTIVELDANNVPIQPTTLRQYLNAGGKVVHLADWPLYNVSQDGANVNLAGGGATAVLGFGASDIGNDTPDENGNYTPITITADGKAWGLTQSWTSQRALDSSKADVVLASIQNGAGAAGWVRRFALTPSSGFVRVWDTSVNTNKIDDNVLADVQRLAEYGLDKASAGGATGEIDGVVKDQNGSPVVSAQVKVTADFGSATVTTDDAGKFVLVAVPGTFTATATGKTVTSSPPATVTVTSGQTTSFTLNVQATAPFVYHIVRAKTPIVIDGSGSDPDWAKAQALVVNTAAQVNAGTWTGPDFLSGTEKVLFDDQYIYILADITDAVPRINVHTDGSIWQGDGVETYVGLDGYDPKRTAYNESRDYQWTIGAGPDLAWKIYRPVAGDRLPPDIPDIAGNLVVKDHAAGQKPGYVVEARMPWTGFPDVDTSLIPPKDGNAAAITFAINDNNDPNVAAAREFGMIFDKTTEAYHDPSTWVRAQWGGSAPVASFTIADATKALSMAVGLTAPSASDLTRYDVDGSGSIDIKDATKILQAAVGL